MAVDLLHILGTARREATGIARMVAALAKGLDPDRYRVHAWFLDGDGPLAAELRSAGAQVRILDCSRGARDPLGGWRFFRAISAGNFALVHQHFGGRAPRRLVRMACQARIVAHAWAHVVEPVSLAAVPFSVPGADLVIATSQAVADGVSARHVRVVYPGVPIPDGPIRQQAASGEEIVVGTAGRLVPLKGIIYLIRGFALACKDLPQCRLEIAGSGPDRAALESEIAASGLAGRIRILDWQPELTTLLPGWDLYVQASLGEPFGIATLEAMAAGLPVVATSAGGLVELVENGRSGLLVPARDPTGLAGALRELLLDPARRRAMGAAGRERARRHFSEEKMIAAVSDIYDEVLAR